MTANVTNYTGYKIDEIEGRIELSGSGFGAVEGRVNLVQNRRNTGGAETVVSWSDTLIVLAVPANISYRSIMVIPDGGGGPYVGTNLNPQPNTLQFKGVIWDTASSPAADELLITGAGLAGFGWIALLDANVLILNPLVRPDAPVYNPAHGIATVAWSDLEIAATGAALGGLTVAAIYGYDAIGNLESIFDNPDFTIA